MKIKNAIRVNRCHLLLCLCFNTRKIQVQFEGKKHSLYIREELTNKMNHIPAHHCQLLECLMTLKHNVVKDLLCVIAYGTAASRSSAAKLLFYYWPTFNANLFDRRGLLMKFNSELKYKQSSVRNI